jgi:hypothetical protein
VIERPLLATIVARVIDVRSVSRTDYGLTAKVTRIQLSEAWLDPDRDRLLSAIREATVFVVSEPLTLALDPFDDDICGSTIELQRVHAGSRRAAGSWSRERTDVGHGRADRRAGDDRRCRARPGPKRSTDTVHVSDLARNRSRTAIAEPLRRSMATLRRQATARRAPRSWAAATRRTLQSFCSCQPLTYLPDRNALGARSTLELRSRHDPLVRRSLIDLGAKDHGYLRR